MRCWRRGYRENGAHCEAEEAEQADSASCQCEKLTSVSNRIYLVVRGGALSLALIGSKKNVSGVDLRIAALRESGSRTFVVWGVRKLGVPCHTISWPFPSR
jgi:hypothetical protein